MFGEVALDASDTLGDKVSNPLPALPVHLARDNLPFTRRNKIAALNYRNGERTYIRLYFQADEDGPFYKQKDACATSKPESSSLWFRPSHPEMSYDDFGENVCFVRIVFNIGKYDIDYMYVIGTSYWKNEGVFSSLQKVIRGKYMISEGQFNASTCLRYR